jgi:hypothetical protein
MGQQRLHNTKSNVAVGMCECANIEELSTTRGDVLTPCTTKIKYANPTGLHDVNEEGQRIQVKISLRALDIHVIRFRAHC